MLEIFLVYMLVALVTLGIALWETKFTPKNFTVIALAALVWPVTWLLFVLDR